jgi:phospholipid transport system substrate-binding protein
MWVKQISSVLLAISLLGVSAMSSAEDTQDPYAMIQNVANTTFTRIKSEQGEIQKNPEILRTILEQEMLPYVDYKFAALKVLGKYFKSVPKEKVPEFIQVFREYLITTYALALGYYNNQDVEFEPTRDLEDDSKTVTVRALVKEKGRPDIKLAFKVRKNSQTDEWKAYDMVAEGISMLSSKQSEFEAILRQQGIQAVIDLMQEKIKQPMVAKAMQGS